MTIHRIKQICKSLFLTSLLVLIGTSCSQDEKEIRKTSESYLTAFVNYRFDEAKKFGDESVAAFLNEMQRVYDIWTPEERQQNLKRIENVKVNILSVEIKDIRAKVKYEFTKDGEILQTDILSLIKKDGAWKVQEFM